MLSLAPKPVYASIRILLLNASWEEDAGFTKLGSFKL
jgi:hypothetical protein